MPPGRPRTCTTPSRTSSWRRRPWTSWPRSAGINAANLAQTVARYNELCASGEDTDFGKKPGDLIPLEEGPYYAIEESGCCLVTVNGLRIDADSRVLTGAGAPIEGLYALGNGLRQLFNGPTPTT